MDSFSFVIIVTYMVLPSLKFSSAIDGVSQTQSISDGKTLVSKGGVFELGFFSPGSTTKRYLGIWYKNIHIDRVVWVANLANPINDSSGILTFTSTGNLELRQNDSVVWSTAYQKQAQNSVAQILDSGNLVIRNEGDTNPDMYLWQSFDYPSDTLLPGMKLGWDLRTGLERKLTSWKSPDDPSLGNFSWGLMLYSYPELYVMKGTQKYYRTGPWNGLQFSGVSDQIQNQNAMYVSNNEELFYSYTLINNSVTVKVKIINASFQTHVWEKEKEKWRVNIITPGDFCDMYGLCGANAVCSITDSRVCQCLEGFSPKSQQEWNTSNWRQGCIQNEPFHCKERDVFVKYVGMKVPETTHTWVDENINLDECRARCFNNCSCMAFTNSDIRGAGSGCVLWFGELFDVKESQTGGQDLYIRMSVSEFEFKVKDNIESQLGDLDLPLFDLLTITTATNNFSLNNKIGQGGFGQVYKGKLADGRDIAVKRLSRGSGQGITEFITEVKLIAKLQHRDLVKLLGCCFQGDEKLLIYEFMVNGSLDSIIFDQVKGKFLDWPQRFHNIWNRQRACVSSSRFPIKDYS